MRALIRLPDSSLPARCQPAAWAALPLLSVLLAVRARGGRAHGSAARQLAGAAPPGALSSLSCRRLRSGAVTPAIRALEADTSMTVNLRVILWVLLGMALFAELLRSGCTTIRPPSPPRAPAPAAPAAPLDSSAPTASDREPPSAGRHRRGAAAASGRCRAVAASAEWLAAQAPLAAARAPRQRARASPTCSMCEVSLAGGELDAADLLAYPQAKNTPGQPVRLLNAIAPITVRAAERACGHHGEAAPTHLALYSSDARELHLAPDAERAAAAAAPGATATASRSPRR